MGILIEAKKIQALSEDFYNKKITVQEYRERRKLILNKIDLDINGVSAIVDDDSDKSFVNKMVSYFKSENNAKDTVE